MRSNYEANGNRYPSAWRDLPLVAEVVKQIAGSVAFGSSGMSDVLGGRIRYAAHVDGVQIRTEAKTGAERTRIARLVIAEAPAVGLEHVGAGVFRVRA